MRIVLIILLHRVYKICYTGLEKKVVILVILEIETLIKLSLKIKRLSFFLKWTTVYNIV